ncbi:MAG: DUF58 domain-containing protein [Clostridia bacterium]|nr:DUF58 domain-containing protein [Clostridia bacterium]
MSRTRLGCAVWLLAACALYFFENNAGTRALLVSSFLLPALSVACAALAARRAGCALQMPERIGKGERARGRCRLTGSRLLFGCGLTCGLAVENPLTGEKSGMTLTAAGAEASFDLEVVHCGQLRVQARAAVGDWFGLARFPAGVAEAAALVPPGLAAGPQADAAPSDRRDGALEPDGGLRDYVPGDPVRLIHWKLSAKLDKPLVREAGGGDEGGLVLLLETARSGASPRAMDEAAEAFLSLSRELARRGARHSACWYDYGPGELRLFQVNGPADWGAMQAQALRAASSEDGGDIVRRFEAAYPSALPGRPLVFSPRGREGGVVGEGERA